MAATMVINGDCREVMRTLEADSVDAIVTDPPYGLEFMGKEFDKLGSGATQQAWHYAWAVEALRVAKPGAHLLAFGGPRTFHRLACALEDAGWELRDTIMWVYGSGFPKSLDVSKAIDKAAGVEREVVGTVKGMGKQNPEWNGTAQGRAENSFKPEYALTAPATDDARRWEGWGTGLKPAYEPIIVARKPLASTVAANVLRYGTGALNIDGCRVAPTGESQTRDGEPSQSRRYTDSGSTDFAATPGVRGGNAAGRWPANLIHDGSDEVVALFPARAGAAAPASGPTRLGDSTSVARGRFAGLPDDLKASFHGYSGSAARFFYCAKAAKSERGPGNDHPTVKPTALMRYLVRLVTPPGGLVLDPFCGSGTTGVAARLEGFDFMGIEKDPAYYEIARARLVEGA